MTPHTAARQASLFFTISWSLLQLMSIESVLPSSHLILCRSLLLPPSIFPSIRIFSNKSTPRIRWPKYISFSISPSNEYSGLISFRMDWFDLLAVQGTLKSLLQLEIKQVHPKGNQPQIFIGRTDAEAEAPVLWPPDAKSRLTFMLGKIEGGRRRG